MLFTRSFSKTTLYITLSSAFFYLPSMTALAELEYEGVCPIGWVKDDFNDADYDRVAPNATPPLLGKGVIVGTTPKGNDGANESYLSLDGEFISPSKMDNIENEGVTNVFRGDNIPKYNNTSSTEKQFYFEQNFLYKEDFARVRFRFKNKYTQEPLAIDKFTLSVYDIDQPRTLAGGNAFAWRDKVSFIAYKNGRLVKGIRVKHLNAGQNEISRFSDSESENVFYHNNENFTAYGRGPTVCQQAYGQLDDTDPKCALKIEFPEPIEGFDLLYGNVAESSRGFRDISRSEYKFGPTTQNISIRFEHYCYKALPRITYKKEMASNRLNNNDQFKVKIKDDTEQRFITDNIVNDTTQTTGTGNVVNTGSGTTGIFKLAPNHKYTLTEAPANGTDLSRYQAKLQCTKKDGSPYRLKNGVQIDASELDYNEHLMCTITNKERTYKISGVVFNDNAGMNDNNANKFKTGDDYNKPEYFNGQKDPMEQNLAGGKVIIDRCDKSHGSEFNRQEQTVTEQGYEFELTRQQIGTNFDNLCLTQEIPPSNSNYPYIVDTTPNNIKVPLQQPVYEYTDQNFGQVIEANSALVLEKRQYVNDCSINNLQNIKNSVDNPLRGYSKQSINRNDLEKVNSEKCIAYKITAINRSNLAISDVVIQDALQKSNDSQSILTAPTPSLSNNLGGIDSTSVQIGQNGTVISDKFSLQPKHSESLFFNTKYKY